MGKKSHKKRGRGAKARDQDGKRAFRSKHAVSSPKRPSTGKGGPFLESRWVAAALLGLVTVLVFLIYSGSLKGPLIFDSVGNIELVSPMKMEELSIEEMMEAVSAAPNRQRPVANASLALNYYFSGTQARGFRIINILIHLVTGILLYLLFRSTLETPALADRELPRAEIAFFAALLWLLHPLAVQSVAYVVQRHNSQAAMFFVLALWLYVRARVAASRHLTVALALASLFAGLLAIGSKEIAATLPFCVLLYEWYFFQDLRPEWLKRAAGAILAAVVAFAVAGLVFIGTSDPVGQILRGFERRDFTLVERLLTETRVVVFYLTQLVFPHPGRLNLDHDFELSRSLVAPPSTLLSILFLAMLLGVAMWTARRHRLLSFGLLWYLGNLVIESSFVPLEIIFEHRAYLPSMFLSLLLVLGVFGLLRSVGLRRALLVAIAIVLSLWTYQRASVWGDDLTFWQDTVAKSPDKPRPHHNLGVVMRDRGQFVDAVPHFRRAIQLDPSYAVAHLNLGHALMNLGKTSEALDVYTEGVAREPSNAKLHFDRSLALAKLGRTREEIEALREAIRLNPNHAAALSNLGATLLTEGQIDEAIEILTRAVEVGPGNPKAHFNLGQALKSVGRTEEAERHLELAERLKDGSPQ